MSERNRCIPIDPSNVTYLRGHSREVLACRWIKAPFDILASGSGDNNTKLWHLGDHEEISVNNLGWYANKHDLYGYNGVGALDWKSDGTALVTASFLGNVAVWWSGDRAPSMMRLHRSPIFEIKWNKMGTHVVTASADRSTAVWSPSSRQLPRRYPFHTQAVLDVDWKDNATFASAGADRCIQICSINKSHPLRTLRGHTDTINTIRWDPQGNLLASCSHDKTVKIWNAGRRTWARDLQGHHSGVYTVRWSPTGPGTDYPNSPRILASAGYDKAIRLWDAVRGVCVGALNMHTKRIYSIAFSPNGRLLASAGIDRWVYVWCIRGGGPPVRSYRCAGSISEISWNSRGDKLGASSYDGNVILIDLR